jgi:hypothetical protein
MAAGALSIGLEFAGNLEHVAHVVPPVAIDDEIDTESHGLVGRCDELQKRKSERWHSPAHVRHGLFSTATQNSDVTVTRSAAVGEYPK